MFSASDVANCLACHHLLTLDLEHAAVFVFSTHESKKAHLVATISG